MANAVCLKFRNRLVDAIRELAEPLMRHLDATRIPYVALAGNIPRH